MNGTEKNSSEAPRTIDTNLGSSVAPSTKKDALVRKEDTPAANEADTRAHGDGAPRAPSSAATASATDPRYDAKAAADRFNGETKKEAEPRAHVAVTERLPENVAGMLSYLFGWVSGILFLLLDRRPFVRFHAAQSVAVFATLSIVQLVLSDFLLAAFIPGWAGALLVLRRIVELVWLVATVVLMLKAVGGERYRVALAAPFAERAAHAVK